MRLPVPAAFLVAVVFFVPASASAQDVGPRAGSWAAEATPSGEVSLLRFRSSTSAWLIGFSGFYNKRDEDTAGGGLDGETTTALVRLGWRGYRATQSRVRPFTTIAALVGYDDIVFGPTWNFGGQFEYGGAYFFTPNVSLGASLALRAVYGSGSREQPLGAEVDVTQLTINTGLRFLGAVYF